MRTSTVVISLAVAAAAAPALAVPVSSPSETFARRTDATGSSVDESGAANWGNILTGASIGVPIISGIISHFTNKNKRELDEFMALVAREDDESAAAIKWGNVLTGASIGIPIIGGIIDHFTNKNKREFDEFMSLVARGDDESAAAIKWGNVLTGASIGLPIISGIIDHFTNKNKRGDLDESGALAMLEALGRLATPQGKREIEELLARADDYESGAKIDITKAANIGGALNNVFSIVNGIYTKIRDRRDDVDESGAAGRAEAANGISSLAYYGYNIVSSIVDNILHKDKNKREIMELLARGSDDDVSAALALGLLGHGFPHKNRLPARSLNELD